MEGKDSRRQQHRNSAGTSWEGGAGESYLPFGLTAERSMRSTISPAGLLWYLWGGGMASAPRMAFLLETSRRGEAIDLNLSDRSHKGPVFTRGARKGISLPGVLYFAPVDNRPSNCLYRRAGFLMR
jgi:hypothetical protein